MSQGFEFNAENLKRKDDILSCYPEGYKQAAIIPLLDLAQRQNDNYLSRQAIEYIAAILDMPHIRVYEVASFYTMFNLNPVGKNVINICTTTPCWLRNSDDVVKACKDSLGIALKQTTKDGQFTLNEVECLGACVNAPMIQINDDYYEDLDYDGMVKIIDALKKGEKPKIGSQIGRSGSKAASNPEGPEGKDLHAS